MKKKKQSKDEPRPSTGYDHIGSESDFYAGSPAEQPLFQDRHHTTINSVRKTGRHQGVSGRRKVEVDPREKMALIAILKSMILIILLVIAFFLLWKGIKIYEESVFQKTHGDQDVNPVLKELVLVEDFDIENQDSREMFAERVDVWRESTRLVRSAEGLIQRNNYDQAISRCQDALRLNPTHHKALETLGELYFMKGLYVESINSYIRLLSVDPARVDLKRQLIKVLDAHEDSNAVIFMARWYQDEHEYSGEVQRYLANALFHKEEFPEAVEEYRRVLIDDPDDLESLEKMADAYIYIEDYANALTTLEKLQAKNYRDQLYYRKIAICHAQLGQSSETVQTLGKAAHLFGQQVVIGWVQDPRLDPIREDRTFQAFADRVGGEEFRKWLEKVAQSMEGEQGDGIDPQLSLPKQDSLKSDLLKANQ